MKTLFVQCSTAAYMYQDLCRLVAVYDKYLTLINVDPEKKAMQPMGQ